MERKLWPQIVSRDFSYPAGTDERNRFIPVSNNVNAKRIVYNYNKTSISTLQIGITRLPVPFEASLYFLFKESRYG